MFSRASAAAAVTAALLLTPLAARGQTLSAAIQPAVSVTRPGELVNQTLVIGTLSEPAVPGPWDSLSVALRIPAGFRLAEGSLALNGDPLEWNEGAAEGAMVLSIPCLDPDSTLFLSYGLHAAAALAPGDFTVTARVQGAGTWLSPEASAVIRLDPAPVFQEAIILGRVFHDENGDGRQTPGESGLAGVRLAMEDGLIARTDGQGLFHFTTVQAGTHLVKIDVGSLPVSPLTDETRGGEVTVLGGTRRLVEATAGQPVQIVFPVVTTEHATLGKGTETQPPAPGPPASEEIARGPDDPVATIELGEKMFVSATARLRPTYERAFERLGELAESERFVVDFRSAPPERHEIPASASLEEQRMLAVRQVIARGRNASRDPLYEGEVETADERGAEALGFVRSMELRPDREGVKLVIAVSEKVPYAWGLVSRKIEENGIERDTGAIMLLLIRTELGERFAIPEIPEDSPLRSLTVDAKVDGGTLILVAVAPPGTTPSLRVEESPFRVVVDIPAATR